MRRIFYEVVTDPATPKHIYTCEAKSVQSQTRPRASMPARIVCRSLMHIAYNRKGQAKLSIIYVIVLDFQIQKCHFKTVAPGLKQDQAVTYHVTCLGIPVPLFARLYTTTGMLSLKYLASYQVQWRGSVIYYKMALYPNCTEIS